MANKAISELPQAQNVNNQDLFVLEQSGIAKKLTAETFITEQGIIDALAEALDGHGGISSVTLSSVSGRIRTYLITFTDQSATTFQVLDGTSIDRITKTSTAGLTDTYTVFMSDGTTTFFTVTNGADGTVSEAMLNDALKDKAPAVTETTESSTIATFTDGADDMVMHHVIAEINPVQSGSGDPSPDNIRPISGWTGCNVTRTGANVWDEVWELGAIDGNTGLPIQTDGAIRSKNFISVVPLETYYFLIGTSGVYTKPFFYDAEHNYIGRLGDYVANQTFVVPSNARYMKFGLLASYGTTYNNDISINYPSSDHDYHAYQGSNTASLSWQTEAGTVYGGTIDVATGLLTVDKGIITINGSESTWNDESTRFALVMPGTYDDSTAGRISIICDTFRSVMSGGTAGDCFGYFNPNKRLLLYFYPLNGENLSQFESWLSSNNTQVVYPLATPQTYQLTPQEVKTLLGTNNIWTDTGDTSVTYAADTKLFIEKLTMPTEDDLVANQAITSGKYFMVGNSLYLALANIASGAQITIGTNAQRVSLADALNTINS